MVEIGVLRESDNDNEVWSSDPIKPINTAPKGKAVLLASKKNKKIKELTINEKKIEVQMLAILGLVTIVIQIMRS